MAIDRLRSPYNNLLAVKGDVGPSAYSNAQVGGTTPFNFVGDGSTNTIVGVTYRCHVFEYTSGQNYSITFNRAGVVDALVCAGGGAGGGVYGPSGASSGYAGGGGGAGGLILSYTYGVTASTYSLSVGKGGIGIPGSQGVPTTSTDSVFGALTAVKGGSGSAAYSSYAPSSGGSGGGGATGAQAPHVQAVGTAGQGNSGGLRSYTSSGAGGGGGYSTQGGDGYQRQAGDGKFGGHGGNGIELRFDSTLRGFSAGGGGGSYGTVTAASGVGGVPGGGAGSFNGVNSAGGDASNFGSGGGGACVNSAASHNPAGGDGSDGLVIIRYALG
jgi:hypothetical protein